MAEPSADARIRDLERRLDMDPGSRLFVSLAEEYRKLGRFRQALSALQKGLLAHPGYIAAQVALGRVYLEVGQSTDAIATFTKVLVADPGNLVASKSLADIYLSRGEKLDAVKKYKLYRALSGDRKVDEVIATLEAEVTPRPITPTRSVAKAEPPPPPPRFQETDKSKRRPSLKTAASQRPSPNLSDAFDITSVAFEPGEDSGHGGTEDPFPFFPTRDTALSSPEAPPPPPPPVAESAPPAVSRSDAPPAEAATPSAVSAPEAASADAAPDAPPADAPPPPSLFRQEPDDAAFGEAPALFQNADEASPVEGAAPTSRTAEAPGAAAPAGRALADLYYSQGHYAEALQIYDDLVTRHPFDEELMRMRRDAEARLLPAGLAPSAAMADSGVERRRARIRALERWLSLVQAG